MSKGLLKEELKREAKLAQERTLLSNERTMLSSVRTAFTAFLFGIGLIGFFKTNPNVVLVGAGFIILGVVIGIIGVVYYIIRAKRIKGY